MAKQSEGYLGGFSGKLGPAVGYRWKGIWCVRSRPRFVHNPRTEAQQAHRSMFKAEVQLAGKMRWALNIGLKLPSDELDMTPMNLFVKGNQQAFSLVDGAFTVDYSMLRISGGTVAPVALTEAVLDEDNVLDVRFEKNPLRRTCSAFDNVYLWVFSEELQQGYLSNPVYRRAQRASVALPDEFQGGTLHVYAFAQDEQGRCSETAYAYPTDSSEDPTDSSVSPSRAASSPNFAPLRSQAMSPTGPGRGEQLDSVGQRDVEECVGEDPPRQYPLLDKG